MTFRKGGGRQYNILFFPIIQRFLAFGYRIPFVSITYRSNATATGPVQGELSSPKHFATVVAHSRRNNTERERASCFSLCKHLAKRCRWASVFSWLSEELPLHLVFRWTAGNSSQIWHLWLACCVSESTRKAKTGCVFFTIWRLWPGRCSLSVLDGAGCNKGNILQWSTTFCSRHILSILLSSRHNFRL